MPGRGNGLDAEAYKPLTDLDPEYADDMLDTLRTEGVAAYVTPLDQEPDLLRLWVDAAATSRARTLLRERREEWEEWELAEEAGEASGTAAEKTDRAAATRDTAGEATGSDADAEPAEAGTAADATGAADTAGPRAAEARPAEPKPATAGARADESASADAKPAEGNGAESGPVDGKPAGAGAPAAPDEDELWAQIVAGFNTEPSDPVPRWPVAEDVDSGSGNRKTNVTRPGDGSFRVGVTTPGPRDWQPADGKPEDGDPDELDEDPNDHFIPPHPPPLPKTDMATKIAWIALLGGPLFLLCAVLLGRPIGEWSTFLAIAICGGGFIALVSRLRRDGDEDDPDHGAVV